MLIATAEPALEVHDGLRAAPRAIQLDEFAVSGALNSFPYR
jgi:hypothetical protein